MEGEWKYEAMLAKPGGPLDERQYFWFNLPCVLTFWQALVKRIIHLYSEKLSKFLSSRRGRALIFMVQFTICHVVDKYAPFYHVSSRCEQALIKEFSVLVL